MADSSWHGQGIEGDTDAPDRHAPGNGSRQLVQLTAGGFRDEATRGVRFQIQHLDDLFCGVD